MSKKFMHILPKFSLPSSFSSPSSSPDSFIEHAASSTHSLFSALRIRGKLNPTNANNSDLDAANKVTNLPIRNISYPSHPLQKSVTSKNPSRNTNETANTDPFITSITESLSNNMMNSVRHSVDSKPMAAPPAQLHTHKSQKLVELRDIGHCISLMDYLNNLRLRNELCDVKFRVTNKDFYGHRVILSSASSYFEGMFIGEFSEPDTNNPIIIEDLDQVTFEFMITYIYSGRIFISDQTVYGILRGSVLMGFPTVADACIRFLYQILDKKNCIRIRSIAKEYQYGPLMAISEEYVRQNFVAVTKENSFLLIEKESLLELIQIDRLEVTQLEDIYESVMRWLEFNYTQRINDLNIIFPQLKLQNMDEKFINSILVDPRILKNPVAIEIVKSALRKKQKDILQQNENTTPPVPFKKSKNKEVRLETEHPPVNSKRTYEILRKGGLLGIKILGGMDRPNHILRSEDSPGIFLTEIQPFGAISRQEAIQPGDRILTINGINLDQAAHSDVIHLLSICPDPVKLTIKHEPPLPGLIDVSLHREFNEVFGVFTDERSFKKKDSEIDENELYIKSLSADGAATRDSRLLPGLTLIHINSVSLVNSNLTAQEVETIIETSGQRLHMLLWDRTLEESSYLNIKFSVPQNSSKVFTLPPSQTKTSGQIEERSLNRPKPTPAKRTSFFPVSVDGQVMFDELLKQKENKTSNNVPSKPLPYAKDENIEVGPPKPLRAECKESDKLKGQQSNQSIIDDKNLYSKLDPLTKNEDKTEQTNRNDKSEDFYFENRENLNIAQSLDFENYRASVCHMDNNFNTP